jgi:cell division protein FtsL
MSAVDFEYAIKKDVRNNPIVREVDAARQRELWQTAGILGLLVLVVLFSVWQNFELVSHGYAMQKMQQQRAEEIEINRQLRLEVETLRSPARIERRAIQDLGLIAPSGDNAIVIERVTSPAAPDRSIVAAR